MGTNKGIDTTGLITPANLPQNVLYSLRGPQITELGYWLFEQLAAQRDHTREEVVQGKETAQGKGSKVEEKP